MDKASETLQEVAVETCGAMEKHEKADFLLEQLRLTLTQKDTIRSAIVARKVNEKTLALEGFEVRWRCAGSHGEGCRAPSSSHLRPLHCPGVAPQVLQVDDRPAHLREGLQRPVP